MANHKKNNTTDANINTDNVFTENEQLKNEVSELKALVQQLLSSQKEEVKVQIKEEDEEIKMIELHKPIKVMSLSFGGLNLKTANEGNMTIFRFEEFGASQPILYADLVKIINNQSRLAKEGHFIIFDKDVIKLHYLEKHYKKFLDKKTIDHILDFDDDKIEDLFKNTTKHIQQTIVDLLIDKIIKGEYLNRNKISVISDVYGKDLFQLAEQLK